MLDICFRTGVRTWVRTDTTDYRFQSCYFSQLKMFQEIKYNILQAETDGAAGGKNENQETNKDSGDRDVCNELRGKIQALKREIKMVKLDTDTIQEKCHYLKKEIEVFQK